jgi:hypothetical protein
MLKPLVPMTINLQPVLKDNSQTSSENYLGKCVLIDNFEIDNFDKDGF